MYNDKIIYYYLDTDRYFRMNSWDFFDVFGHTGDCIGNDGGKYEYLSAVALKAYQREHDDGGHFIYSSNVRQFICKYFTMNYSDMQLFAIVFGAWYGLCEEQIHLIANRNKHKIAWYILNALLCNMPTDEMKSLFSNKSITFKEKFNYLKSVSYHGEYFIRISHNEYLPVTKVNKDIIKSASGEKYKII